MQMATVAQRLNERFVHALHIDRLRASVEPAMKTPRTKSSCRAFELIEHQAESMAEQPVGIGVDEILGHEEVVVRNLPGPLANHPFFSGLTLSGLGETVLLLDSSKLLDFLKQHQAAEAANVPLTNESDESTEQRVLVVDDSMSARKLLVKKLNELGWTTVEATDGIEALQQLRKSSFCLVMTDLDMPRLGGLELLTDIQHRHGNEMPVVVVSSRKEVEFAEQILNRGAIAYLQKPVDDAKLNHVLESLQTNK